MIRRHRFLFLCLAAVVVGLAVGGWLLWPQSSAITRENAAKIQSGMTLAEIETILGGPARNECTGPIAADVTVERLNWGTRSGPMRKELNWHSDAVSVRVVFNPDDKARAAHSLNVHRTEDSILAMLRRWLGL